MSAYPFGVEGDDLAALSEHFGWSFGRGKGSDMPDVRTPQPTWQDAAEVQRTFLMAADAVARAAVAARDREVATRLRAKIEALAEVGTHRESTTVRLDAVLEAVLDAVLGGDS